MFYPMSDFIIFFCLFTISMLIFIFIRLRLLFEKTKTVKIFYLQNYSNFIICEPLNLVIIFAMHNNIDDMLSVSLFVREQ